MPWDPNQIRAGNQAKKEAEENAMSFAREGGSITGAPSQSLDQKAKTRMAGPGGAFAQSMMDPETANRVNLWNMQFGQSNQGMEWNRAKTMQMAAQPQPGDDQQEEQAQ